MTGTGEPPRLDGPRYQERFDSLAAGGFDVHGEADLVTRQAPASVLDAGCGTGRVAVELARRGLEVVGVDVDTTMLGVARQRAPELSWIEADLTGMDLGRRFDLVLMAGNVPLFTRPGTASLLVARCAAHVAPGGLLVAGFELGRGYDLATYDADCATAGLSREARWSTWDEDPFLEGGDYAVSLHRARPWAGRPDPTSARRDGHRRRRLGGGWPQPGDGSSRQRSRTTK